MFGDVKKALADFNNPISNIGAEKPRKYNSIYCI
jgi:hypothetical protein